MTRRLTPEAVKAIRLSPASDESLAARYGVHVTTLHRARAGQTWRDVVASWPEPDMPPLDRPSGLARGQTYPGMRAACDALSADLRTRYPDDGPFTPAARSVA